MFFNGSHARHTTLRISYVYIGTGVTFSLLNLDECLVTRYYTLLARFASPRGHDSATNLNFFHTKFPKQLLKIRYEIQKMKIIELIVLAAKNNTIRQLSTSLWERKSLKNPSNSVDENLALIFRCNYKNTFKHAGLKIPALRWRPRWKHWR